METEAAIEIQSDVKSNSAESCSLTTASSCDLVLDVDLMAAQMNDMKDEIDDDVKSTDVKCDEETVSDDTTAPLCQGVDSILDYLGQFGRFQQVLYLMLWLPAASMAAGVYSAVYLEWSPNYTCSDGKDESTSNGNIDYDGACFRSDNVTSCTDFDYDTSLFTSTVVSDFNLVCGRQYIQTLSKTIYMMGMLVGSFVFGWMGDMCGRRMAFLATTICLTLGSVGCAVAPNVEMYIVARFITSCGGMGIFITVFVLSMEFIGPKFRTMCGVAIQIPFALGELYIVLMAYLVRDWRMYQTLLAIPFFSFFAYVFFLPESVRWLISRGRKTEAKVVLCRVAKVNKVILPQMDEDDDETDSLPEMENNSSKPANAGMSQIFLNPTLCLRFFIMALNWVVATLGYYGLSLSSAGLSDDPFTSFALSATMEIPAYLFCISCLDKAGRKGILAFSQILAGTTCLTAALMPAHLATFTTILTLIGKFGASASFAIVFIFTAELFPTPVRNSAIGLCSTSARVGGLLAPTIASLASTNPLLPFLIMGCCSCVGGLAALLLPETAGLPLPDTVQEAVSIGSKKKIDNYRQNLLVVNEKLIQTEKE